MLPGMPRMASGSGPFFRNSSSASDTAAGAALSTTISAPSGTEIGDMMVMYVGASDYSSNSSIATISGWTLQDSYTNSSTGGLDYKLLTRVFQSGDTSWTATSTGYNLSVVCLSFGNVTSLGNAQRDTSGDVSDGITSTTAGSAMAVFGGFSNSSTSTPSVSSTPTETTTETSKTADQGNYAVLVWAGYEENLPGGATGTRTWVVANNTYEIFYLLELK